MVLNEVVTRCDDKQHGAAVKREQANLFDSRSLPDRLRNKGRVICQQGQSLCGFLHQIVNLIDISRDHTLQIFLFLRLQLLLLHQMVYIEPVAHIGRNSAAGCVRL